MIVECPHCESRVDGKVIAQHQSPYITDPDYGPYYTRVSLVECPACNRTLLVGQESDDLDDTVARWSLPWRLWPAPKRDFSWEIPDPVRFSLEEAERCVKATAYTASAVMCGRALEAICRHFNTSSKNIEGGLK